MKGTRREYRAAVAVAKRQLPLLREKRTKLIAEMDSLSREISLAESIIALWGAGESREPNGRPMPIYEMVAGLLREKGTLPVQEIADHLTKQKGSPVSRATVYSAILRKTDLFEKDGKGYRLRQKPT